MKDSRATTLDHGQEQKPEEEKNVENRVLEKTQEGRVHHRSKQWSGLTIVLKISRRLRAEKRPLGLMTSSFITV